MELEARWGSLKEAQRAAGVGRRAMLTLIADKKVTAKRNGKWLVWMPSLAPGYNKEATEKANKENEEITKLAESTRLKEAEASDLEAQVRIKKANAELEGIVDKKAVEDFHKKKEAVEQTEVEQTKEWGAIQDAKVDLRDRRETVERQINELKKWMPKFEAIKRWACEVSAIITNSDQWADKKLELPEDPAGSKEDTAQINRWLKKEEERKESQEASPTQADSGMFAEESEEE